MDQQERIYAEVDDLDLTLVAPQRQAQQRDYARIDTESLPLPELVMPPTAAEPKREPEPERLPPGFWERFGEALGIDLGVWMKTSGRRWH